MEQEGREREESVGPVKASLQTLRNRSLMFCMAFSESWTSLWSHLSIVSTTRRTILPLTSTGRWSPETCGGEGGEKSDERKKE